MNTLSFFVVVSMVCGSPMDMTYYAMEALEGVMLHEVSPLMKRVTHDVHKDNRNTAAIAELTVQLEARGLVMDVFARVPAIMREILTGEGLTSAIAPGVSFQQAAAASGNCQDLQVCLLYLFGTSKISVPGRLVLPNGQIFWLVDTRSSDGLHVIIVYRDNRNTLLSEIAFRLVKLLTRSAQLRNHPLTGQCEFKRLFAQVRDSDRATQLPNRHVFQNEAQLVDSYDEMPMLLRQILMQQFGIPVESIFVFWGSVSDWNAFVGDPLPANPEWLIVLLNREVTRGTSHIGWDLQMGEQTFSLISDTSNSDLVNMNNELERVVALYKAPPAAARVVSKIAATASRHRQLPTSERST